MPTDLSKSIKTIPTWKLENVDMQGALGRLWLTLQETEAIINKPVESTSELKDRYVEAYGKLSGRVEAFLTIALTQENDVPSDLFVSSNAK